VDPVARDWKGYEWESVGSVLNIFNRIHFFSNRFLFE
jgi:hypothetical protein